MNKVHIIRVFVYHSCIVWQLMLLFTGYSDNAQPVCLPTQDDLLSNATNCYITGFGSIVQSILDRKYMECFVLIMILDGQLRVVLSVNKSVQLISVYHRFPMIFAGFY